MNTPKNTDSAGRKGWRRGQAPVEYLLVTVSLLFLFVFMYRFLQGFLAREFKAGGTIIVRMYSETPW